MYDAVVAFAALVANEELIAFKTYDAVAAFEALKAYDALAAFRIYDAVVAVPSKEPVNEVAVTLPLILTDPVMLWVSVIIFPNLTPVSVTWNSTPLPVMTVREPVMIVLPNTSKRAFGDVLLGPIPTLPLVEPNITSPVTVCIAL